MDVGFYLGELLVQHGEVSVPGLGSFTQARMSAYYDENEGKLYPPYHQAQFNTYAADDDVLTEYIARKKNISLASAKYFTEKYITNLKEEAPSGEVPVAGLGWFYIADNELAFKPAQKITEDAAFYGYEGVKITRRPPPVEESEEVVLPKQKVTPPQREGKLEEVKEEEEPLDDYIEEDVKKPINKQLVAMIVVISLGALFALYRYNSATISKLFGKHHTIDTPAVVKPTVTAPVKVNPVKADSEKKIVPAKTDTLKKPVNAVITKKTTVDTTNKERFEVIATSFKTMDMANKTIKNFKSIGVDAHVVPDAPGRLLKISVGTYATRKDAEAARIKLVMAGKIQKDAFSLPIKPKQKY